MTMTKPREPFADQPRDFSRLFDRQPPHSIEAECALLGSMILDWRVIGEVVQIIAGADDFYRQANANIYQVLVDQYDKHQSGDMVQLHDAIRDRGLLEQVGGTAYLVELAESVPSADAATRYARIVHDKARLRTLIAAGCEMVTNAYHADGREVNEIIDDAESSVYAVADAARSAAATTEAEGVGAVLQRAYDQMTKHDGIAKGMPTGFIELDDMLNGLHDGEMIIVGSRPSQGKTALAVNIAEHVALEAHEPVVVFSMEMSKQQLGQRIACSRSGVDSHKMRRNMLGADDFQTLARTVGELTESPLYIDDKPGLSLMELRGRARRYAAKYGPKLVIIDYLQLMSTPGNRNRNRENEVSELSRGIKALARDLNVPIVVLSQLNRSVESREGHRPRMSDLRESGALEQDADVILLLHREDYYHRGDATYQETNIAEVIVGKQRNGPTGVVSLHWHGPTTRFHNLSIARPANDDDGGQTMF